MRDTSQTFHQSNESADLHSDRGLHRQYDAFFENGELVGVCTPDLPALADALNSWYDPDETANGSGFEQAATALKTLIRWVIQADSDRPRHISSIGRRAVALAFAVCPGECGEGWQSMEGAALQLGCTRQSISKYTHEILKLSHGRFERRGTFRGAAARAARSEVSRRQWDKRGRMTRDEKRAARVAYVAAHPEQREAELEKRRERYQAWQAKRALSGA